MKRTDAGIPINYESDEYTFDDQLKELQILNIHESDSEDDIAEDTDPRSTREITTQAIHNHDRVKFSSN